MVLDGEAHIVIRHQAYADRDITLDGKIEDDGKTVKGKYVIDSQDGSSPEGHFHLSEE